MTAPVSPEGRAGRNSAVVWLSVSFVLILLVATAPLIMSFIASVIASISGCEGTMEIRSPCMFVGSEVSHGLTTLIFMGYFAFYSLPLGGFLLAGWAIVACIVVLVRWLRGRRSAV
jgi:hypothetical protein